MSTNEEDLAGGYTDACQKALQINMVIKCIYEFLNLEDFKKCRLVSQKWNFVAEPSLRKRAVISLCANKADPVVGDKSRTIEEFLQDFSTSSSSLPFQSFNFSGNNWKLSELSEFFDNNRQTLKEIDIDGIIINDEEERPINITFDISPWILNAPLTRLYLGFDDVSDEYKSSRSQFKVHLNKIRNIKDLHLDGVLLDLTDVTKTTRYEAQTIYLSGLTFCQNERDMNSEVIRLNDFIDFRKANNINLIFIEEGDERRILLDLGETFTVEELSFRGVKCVNWSSSKCKINTLNMDDAFKEKTKMLIKELKIEISFSSIDLSVLPVKLEELYVEDGPESVVTCTEPINLPNLKFLQLQDSTNVRILSHFAQCVSLTEVRMVDCEATILDLNWLPKYIQKLKIKGTEKIRAGAGALSLDTLILSSASLEDASNVLDSIDAKVLVVNWKQNFETNDSIIKFLRRRHQNNPTYVGPFRWEGSKFQSSCLAKGNYVDKEAEYYRFENEKGEAIEKEEIEVLVDDNLLDEDDDDDDDDYDWVDNTTDNDNFIRNYRNIAFGDMIDLIEYVPNNVIDAEEDTDEDGHSEDTNSDDND